MRLPFIALMALCLTAFVAACSAEVDDSENGAGGSPSPSPAVEASTPTVEPEPTPAAEAPTPTAEPEPTPTPDVMATIRDEAEAVCPSEFLEPCVDAYVAAAEWGLPGALCVSADIENIQTGTWFIKTPPEGAKIGDPCEEEAGHFIVALVNMGDN